MLECDPTHEAEYMLDLRVQYLEDSKARFKLDSSKAAQPKTWKEITERIRTIRNSFLRLSAVELELELSRLPVLRLGLLNDEVRSLQGLVAYKSELDALAADPVIGQAIVLAVVKTLVAMPHDTARVRENSFADATESEKYRVVRTFQRINSESQFKGLRALGPDWFNDWATRGRKAFVDCGISNNPMTPQKQGAFDRVWHVIQDTYRREPVLFFAIPSILIGVFWAWIAMTESMAKKYSEEAELKRRQEREAKEWMFEPKSERRQRRDR